ncbi:MAG: mechanosensitive ion channel family protein [Balneolaceae bacterium]|nr:MAG: mechanosensitive ion channel family protein [Balneolaceae bacterium]
MSERLESYFGEFALFVEILIVLLITYLLVRIVNRIYHRFIERSAKKGDENLTTYKFLEHSISVVLYLIGISFAISMIPFLKPVAQSILGAAGIMAIAIGFAAQQALGNIISGIFIVISKPFQINDRISFNDGLRGVVEDISLRHTVIRNFENQRIIIPNSIISNQMIINSNYTDTKICRLIDIGISYGSDLDLSKQIIREEIENHPLSFDNRTPEDIEKGTPKVMVRVIEFADSSVNLRAWAWAEDAPNAFVMTCDVLESIKKRFDREGIVIPFPQRTISYLESPNGNT